uniref:Uncharacterized protein n=1 Tax=Arundo donax TaxID=35708 RepID=A0A0A9BBP6_ARUDO
MIRTEPNRVHKNNPMLEWDFTNKQADFTNTDTDRRYMKPPSFASIICMLTVSL